MQGAKVVICYFDDKEKVDAEETVKLCEKACSPSCSALRYALRRRVERPSRCAPRRISRWTA